MSWLDWDYGLSDPTAQRLAAIEKQLDALTRLVEGLVAGEKDPAELVTEIEALTVEVARLEQEDEQDAAATS